jgi:hypothetical protein
MAASMAALLRELERLKAEFGGTAPRRKLELLSGLQRGRLARAADVLALHEQLCFMRAYPDDAAVLQRVEQVLHGFERRSDLCRFAERLADSGIAGTPTHYAFYAPTADWPAADRRALAEVVRAKGGRRESDYVRRFDGHRRLRCSVTTLAQRTEG